MKGYFSLRHPVQTGYSSFLSSGYPDVFLESKVAEALISPLSSAEVKNAWSCTLLRHTSSWRGA